MGQIGEPVREVFVEPMEIPVPQPQELPPVPELPAPHPEVPAEVPA